MKQLFGFVLLVTGATVEASAPPVSLTDLLHEAREHNPMLAAARAEAAAVAARVPGASSPGDVMVEGSRKDEVGMRSTALGVRLTMPFPGTSVLAGRAADLEARAAAERARVAELETVAGVRIAYYRLARADGTLAAARDARDLFKQAAAVAKSRAAISMGPGGGAAAAGGTMGGGASGGNGSGQDATTDLLLLEAEAVRMDTMAIMQLNERTIAAADLARWLDRPADRADFGPATLPELPEPALDPERLAAAALDRSADVAAARHRADAAAAESGRMGLMTLPMVSPFYESERLEAGGSSWMAGLGLSYPLWFWKPASDWREARAMNAARRAEARAQEAETVKVVREETSETRSRWRAAVNARDAVIPLLEQAVRSSRASYEGGRTDVLRLLTATREWLAARAEFYEQAYHYGEHWSMLERTVGKPIEEVK